MCAAPATLRDVCGCGMQRVACLLSLGVSHARPRTQPPRAQPRLTAACPAWRATAGQEDQLPRGIRREQGRGGWGQQHTSLTHTHCTGPRRTAGCTGARATACTPAHGFSAQAAAPRAARKCVAHRASVGVTGACCGYRCVQGKPRVRCSLAMGGHGNDCTPDPVHPVLRCRRPLSRADAIAGLARAAASPKENPPTCQAEKHVRTAGQSARKPAPRLFPSAERRLGMRECAGARKDTHTIHRQTQCAAVRCCSNTVQRAQNGSLVLVSLVARLLAVFVVEAAAQCSRTEGYTREAQNSV